MTTIERWGKPPPPPPPASAAQPGRDAACAEAGDLRMSYTNRTFLPLGDSFAERRTEALEKQAAAQATTATQAERAASAMERAAGSASYAQRRAELLALLNTAMSARLAPDITGAVAIAVDTLAAVDEALPEPTEPPPPANG